MLPTYLHSITYFNRQGFFVVFKEISCSMVPIYSHYNLSSTQIALMGFINNISQNSYVAEWRDAFILSMDFCYFYILFWMKVMYNFDNWNIIQWMIVCLIFVFCTYRFVYYYKIVCITLIQNSLYQVSTTVWVQSYHI